MRFLFLKKTFWIFLFLIFPFAAFASGAVYETGASEESDISFAEETFVPSLTVYETSASKKNSNSFAEAAFVAGGAVYETNVSEEGGISFAEAAFVSEAAVYENSVSKKNSNSFAEAAFLPTPSLYATTVSEKNTLPAQPPTPAKITFSLTQFLTYRTGLQNEYVYAENSEGKLVKLSELNWEEKNLFFFGGKGQMKSLGKFSLDVSFAAAIPFYKCGYVYDSDWYNYYSSDEDVASVKTCYSISDCIIDYYFKGSLFASYSLSPETSFDLKPFAGADFNFSHFSADGLTAWYAKKNSGIYDSWESADASYEEGTVLSLKRNSVFTWLGFESIIRPVKKLSLSLTYAFNIYTYVFSLDNHPLKSSYFLDVMSNFFCGYKIAFAADYSLTKKQKVFFKTSYEFIEVTKGNTYFSTSDALETFTDLSGSCPGASFSNLQLTFACQFLF